MKIRLFRVKIALCALLSILMVQAYSQQPAFPGAEGYGRFASGGRGGSVYYVTNLNDSGPGSLRDAVSEPNRTVLFKVSGTIFLKSVLSLSENNITIAGQTAPGDGICVAGYPTSLRANNIIIRYIRFRMGDINGIEGDALYNALPGARGPISNIMIDHCSFSWGNDEVCSLYALTDVTLQWCIVSESLNDSFNHKGKHGYGGLWGGANASFHHNLIAHHTKRSPKFSGSFSAEWPDRELVDLRNNVIYNWGSLESVYGGEEGRQNMVNNYFKPGPATPGSRIATSRNLRNRILQYTSFAYVVAKKDTVWGGKFYVNGNYVDGYPAVTADNWGMGVQPDRYKGAQALMAAAKQDNPFPFAPVTTQSAVDAYNSVLKHAGASLPVRDMVDKRIIQEVSMGKATYEGRSYSQVNDEGVSHPSGIIDSQKDVGGWPELKSAKAPADTDNDGIPDRWEIKMRLDPNDPADGKTYSGDGYTMLEKYLNDIK